MSRLSLDMTQTSRVVDSHGHRSFEPGALREERNEAVLTTLSRGRCLNRPAQAIRYAMVKKLLHTRYRVHDLEKTISFYRDVLGLQEIRRQTSGRGSQLVFLKAPASDEEIAPGHRWPK